MTDAQDPIEERLTRNLHALVDGERAPADIAERAEALVGGLHRARRRRRAVAIDAMAAVSAVIGGVAWAALADDEGERAIRTADDGTTTTTEVDGTSTTEPGVAPPVPPPPGTEPPPTPTTVDDPPERRCAAATGEPRWGTSSDRRRIATRPREP